MALTISAFFFFSLLICFLLLLAATSIANIDIDINLKTIKQVREKKKLSEKFTLELPMVIELVPLISNTEEARRRKLIK